MTVDSGRFREALSQYPTGVAVVALAGPDGVRAMTAGSLTSVSLDPPLVLFCVAKAARFAALVAPGVDLSFNVLRSEQRPLSTYFAGGWTEPVPPPYRFVPWAKTARLEGAAGSLAARITQVLEGGDHLIVVGEVLDIHRGLAPIVPLIFFGRRYHGIDAGAGSAAPEIDSAEGSAQLFYDPWG